eukprot:gene23902-32298_t
MHQSRLEAFMEVRLNSKHKKCFIYDPSQQKAFFDYNPDSVPIPATTEVATNKTISPRDTFNEEDSFIATKCGVRLYLRKFSSSCNPSYSRASTAQNGMEEFNHYSTSLLKSNLQKAVRRQNVAVALQSALLLLQREPMEFLRRLPILYVEDVALMDSIPICIWLLMADKEYSLTSTDITLLLDIVRRLCECSQFYEDSSDEDVPPMKHEDIEASAQADAILAVHYRSLYGGMKGDMRMLRRAVYHYKNHPEEVQRHGEFQPIDWTLLFPPSAAASSPAITILPAAIDFHPFPQLIGVLQQQTGLQDGERIKSCIWLADSALNGRKASTVEAARQCRASADWKRIRPHIDRARAMMIPPPRGKRPSSEAGEEGSSKRARVGL